MHIAELSICGYRLFRQQRTIKLRDGLTVLLGENGSGKSTVIDALRLLLLEDEYGRSGATKTDFHRPLSTKSGDKGTDQFRLDATFEGLDGDQQVAFLPWLDAEDPNRASLHLFVSNEETARGRLKRTTWGGASQASAFEIELLQDLMNCTYLPPLRDAEERLRANRGSRLGRLLKKLRPPPPEGGADPLESMVKEQNQVLEKLPVIEKANASIRASILESLGPVLGQDVLVQFAEVSFDRIVERLQLLFYPLISTAAQSNDRELFRALTENSLGYNNLLYLATILAELDADAAAHYRLLLIEEPEAHLHPQLQTRVLQHLAKLAGDQGVQVVVTTHSPTIAAAVDLEAIQVTVLPSAGECPHVVALGDCGFPPDSASFLRRWLDATRSTLLFARGVILVEGVSEALLVPELARIVLAEGTDPHHTKGQTPEPAPSNAMDTKEVSVGSTAATTPTVAPPTTEQPTAMPRVPSPPSLQDFGVSVISLGGLHFRHFVQLYRGDRTGPPDEKRVSCARLPVRCAGIIDRDPGKDEDGQDLLPTSDNVFPSKNRDASLVEELSENEFCRVFVNLKTFEYDLALEGGNLNVLCSVLAELVDTDGSIKATAQNYAGTDWTERSATDRAEAAHWFLKHVANMKGEFAQTLADRIAHGEPVQVPDYVRRAVLWVTNGD